MKSDLDIQYVKNGDIDRSRWDDAIDRAYNGLPYAYSWYLDMMAGDWDALISIDYNYVMPLPYNTKLFGLRQIFQPHFTQQLGVFGVAEVSEAIVESFLSSIPSKFKYLAYNCNESNPLVEMIGYSAVPRTNMLLDLHRPYETIRKNYRRSLRKRIEESKGSLFFKSDAIGPSDVVEMFKRELSDRVGLTDQDYQKATELITLALKIGKGQVFSCHDASGHVLASVFFLKSNKRMIQLLGSATQEGKRTYATHFLIDAVIEKYSGSDLTFDFEGSEIPSVAEFFRGFGPTIKTYNHVIRDHLPFGVRWVRKIKMIVGSLL